jgi:tetratricopeptide (TPR) repeat protein
MSRWSGGLWACGIAAIGMVIAGCHGLPGRVSRGPTTAGAPQTAPAASEAASKPEIDPAKALLPLESIPPAVKMPPGTERVDREVPSQAVKHYLAARDQFDNWMNSDAIEELEKALRYDPGSFECHLLLGRAAARSGNLGQARNHLREAAKLRPDDVTCQYLLGWLAANSKDPNEAVQRFRLALKCSNAAPDRPETLAARYYLAEELIAQGYLFAAMQQFEIFEEAVSDPRGAFLQNRELAALIRSRRARPAQMIGQAALELHRYGQAAAAFKRALTIEPNDLRTKVRYAQALARAGELNDALQVARELTLTTDQNRAGVDLMGWIYRDAGRPEGLAGELKKLIADHPDRHDLGVVLAETLVGFGRKAEAEEILRRLIKEDPKLATAYERLAMLLIERGKVADSLRVLSQAIAVGPETHVRVLMTVAQLAGRTEVARQVTSEAEAILSAEPRNYALSYVVGLVSFGADRQDLAIRCFTRAIEAKPDFLAAYLSLGRLYLERFDWQQAIDTAERAAKAGLKDASVAYLLARAYDGLDRVEQAESAYQRVIQADPKSMPAILALGELYERVGQRNKAQQEYQRALKIAPGNDQAGERLIRLLLAQGDASQVQGEIERFRRAGGSGPALGRCLAVIASRGDMTRYRKLLNDILSEVPKDVETRYDLATSYYATKDYDKVSEQVDQILKLAPGHQKARFLMAELCRKRLDFEDAGKLISGLLREHPNREIWLLALGEVYLDLQEYDRAADLIEKLIANPSSKARMGAYRARLIGVYTLAKEYDKAIAAAKQWLKDDPASLTAKRTLMEALQEAGRHDEAIRLAQQWLAAEQVKPAKEAPKPEAEEEEGQEADEEGEKEEASRQKNRPEDRRTAGRSLLISAYTAAKQYDQALETLVGWLEEDPSNKWLTGELWVVLSGAKRHAEAVELCRAAMAAGKENRLYRLMLAQSYLKSKRYDEALAVLSSIPPAQRDEQVEGLDIDILVAAKRFDEAQRRAQQIVARNKDEQVRLALARVMLVPLYHRIGRADLAEKEMEKLYAKQPKDPGINNDLGYTYADEGRHVDQAERMLRFALGEEPRNAAYMDSLGWVLYKKGDFKGAARFLGMAIRAQSGQDPVIYDHLGDTYWRLGNKAEATKSWKKALELGLKEQADEKESADPKMLPRVRDKLSQLEKGAEPVVAEFVKAEPPGSQPAEPQPAR